MKYFQYQTQFMLVQLHATAFFSVVTLTTFWHCFEKLSGKILVSQGTSWHSQWEVTIKFSYDMTVFLVRFHSPSIAFCWMAQRIPEWEELYGPLLLKSAKKNLLHGVKGMNLYNSSRVESFNVPLIFPLNADTVSSKKSCIMEHLLSQQHWWKCKLYFFSLQAETLNPKAAPAGILLSWFHSLTLCQAQLQATKPNLHFSVQQASWKFLLGSRVITA